MKYYGDNMKETTEERIVTRENEIKQLARKLFVMCANPRMLKDEQGELTRECFALAQGFYRQQDEIYPPSSRVGDAVVDPSAQLSKEFQSLPTKRAGA